MQGIDDGGDADDDLLLRCCARHHGWGAAHQTRKGVYAVRLEKGGNGKGMGMRLARLGNSIIVLGVVEGSVAAMAGVISVGDSILSVDGDSTEGLAPADVARLFSTGGCGYHCSAETKCRRFTPRRGRKDKRSAATGGTG